MTSKKPIPLWLSLFLGFITSLLLAILLATANASGAFIPWKTLKDPPSNAREIIQLQVNQVWIETEQGQFLTSPLTYGTWLEFTVVSDIPVTWYEMVRGSDCVDLEKGLFPLNPTGSIRECIYIDVPMPEFSEQAYLALMKDGSLRYWMTGHSLFDLFQWIIVFAISFTILLVIVFLVILIIRRKRVND